MRINKHHRIFIIAVGLIFSAAITKAQDIGQTIMNNAAASQYNYMTSHIANLSLKNISGKGKGSAKVGHGLTYNPSPKIKERVLNNIAANLKLDAANIANLKQTNFDGIFTGITAPYHLQANDASDIVAAYQVLNWIIANNSANPQLTTVASVREDTDDALRQNKEIYTDAGKRAMLGEELKIMFVLLHAGWQDAIKKGTTASFSEKIAGQYSSAFGQDLRSLKLDAKGLHP